ncbi:palmitoyl-protein thioesterase 1 [Sphaeroforma arctica JP610]|uniref:Palmitoyl-protein thioesterase 1 n=1 Tax=Sphaeroforma arctica JP610 TaxID=667725 RepID=A0A0L0G312_9EUKA|nr:palmitoyl-protein thioesterase 1 [Sphaeroforma arctica JP610]KNC83470.1 palmitoyl-protein thioesterase 1 [Sphaeroforma arctica JP610]|eukprot:XP_014157372.1 palmitoyl-protein thioesterase 1 [Sphaeroforma arctica JP610]
MGGISRMIKAELGEDTYVLPLMVGSNIADDMKNGFFMPVNDQVDLVCDMVKKDPRLQDGFNAMGFSQGGQFMRAYIQRCNTPKVHNFISVGGQHQGVFGMPKCTGQNFFCEEMKVLLNAGAYLPFVQNYLVQAEYWHDPLQEEVYKKSCVFMPEINNELAAKNQTYRENLQSLNRFVMIKFTKDTMVTPPESEWFGFYAPGQDKEITTLKESDLYKEDWLGLQEMDKNGQLVFLSVEGDHLRFSHEWFVAEIINKYLV